jgi:Phage tail sheath protein subtilisin-like domain/Phage tail sheath C-terminal domain
MPIALSPSVTVTEKDLTNVVPAVATSIGAAVIEAGWGPVNQVVTIDSENEMVRHFGKPNSANAANWFAAANFLAYSNNLLLVRSGTTGQTNAVAMPSSVLSIPVTNAGSEYSVATVTISAPSAGGVQAVAAANLLNGAVASITITNAGSGYLSAPTVSIAGDGIGAAIGSVVLGGIAINNETDYDSKYSHGEGMVGEFAAKYPGSLGNSIAVSMADVSSFGTWFYKDQFPGVPDTSSYAEQRGATNDEMHIVVVDVGGRWTGTQGTILEKFSYVSKASDARNETGNSAYYKQVINSSSKYVVWMDHPALGTNWGTDVADGVTYTPITTNAITRTLSGGADNFTATMGQREVAFDLFNNSEQFDINLIIVGKASATLANYVIQNIAEVRRDCVAFVSPENIASGEALIGNTSEIVDSMIAYRNLIASSSYAFIDSGFKYQYDKYNDQYRWVPLNGDIAGLAARTDNTNDPWFSPAGLNRGQVKNVVKLAFSPRKTDRDNLYKNSINPVVSFPGQGTVLYGDKTALTKPSAFDRINVRRLFIVLEKSIATAAKYQMFEFNDDFTRAQFVGMVSPFLRDVKGRRGIYDFSVVCDGTNNGQIVVDTNNFVADIYIQPERSINFMTLNFVATRTGVSFTEIAGASGG